MSSTKADFIRVVDGAIVNRGVDGPKEKSARPIFILSVRELAKFGKKFLHPPASFNSAAVHRGTK